METGVIALLLMLGRLAFYFFGVKSAKDNKKKEAVKDALKAHKNEDTSMLVDALDRLGRMR